MKFDLENELPSPLKSAKPEADGPETNIQFLFDEKKGSTKFQRRPSTAKLDAASFDGSSAKHKTSQKSMPNVKTKGKQV